MIEIVDMRVDLLCYVSDSLCGTVNRAVPVRLLRSPQSDCRPNGDEVDLELAWLTAAWCQIVGLNSFKERGKKRLIFHVFILPISHSVLYNVCSLEWVVLIFCFFGTRSHPN